MWEDGLTFTYSPKWDSKYFGALCKLPGDSEFSREYCAWEEIEDAWEIINNDEEFSFTAGASRPLAAEKFPTLKMGSTIGIDVYGYIGT